MKKLYAPWRKKYVTDKPTGNTPEACVFCHKLAATDDAKNLILQRYKYNAIIMNLYPYSAGHLMVIPLQHLMYPIQLDTAAQKEMFTLMAHSVQILNIALKSDGTNVGLNLGAAAGAGIPGHLHMHVLPRWAGDTNFMPLLAEVKPISMDLAEIYMQLKPHFENLKIE